MTVTHFDMIVIACFALFALLISEADHEPTVYDDSELGEAPLL